MHGRPSALELRCVDELRGHGRDDLRSGAGRSKLCKNGWPLKWAIRNWADDAARLVFLVVSRRFDGYAGHEAFPYLIEFRMSSPVTPTAQLPLHRIELAGGLAVHRVRQRVRTGMHGSPDLEEHLVPAAAAAVHVPGGDDLEGLAGRAAVDEVVRRTRVALLTLQHRTRIRPPTVRRSPVGL